MTSSLARIVTRSHFEREELLERLVDTRAEQRGIVDGGEVAYAAEFFRWNAEEAVRNLGSLSRAPASGARIMVHHKPAGIAVLVTPWNFPAAMATRKIGPALAAGCPVVLKPASDTPLTMLALMPILAEAGVPYDLIADMDDINPEFANTDVSLVIGANDVVNPVAKTDPASPINGMPILDVVNSRNTIIIKRGKGTGFAGIENALFYADNTRMLYGDGAEMGSALVSELKALDGGH